MSAEYSVESLQRLILSQHSSTSTEAIAALRAFQERIEADESAVPIGYTSQAGIEHLKSWSADAHAKGFGAYEDVITSGPYGNMTVPLFTHPPAQAEQVGAAKSAKAGLDHQVEMLIARAVVSGVMIPDAPPASPLSLSDIVKLIVNSYPLAAIVREMDVQASGMRGAFSPLVPTAEPVAQAGADGGVGIDCVSHSPDAADSGRVVTDEMVRVAVHAWNAAPALGRDEDDDYAMRRALTTALAAQGQGDICPYCDGTGDVHSIDGEWRGECTACPAAMEHAFKNFHRQLCERFGYTHDEKDWRRDQVSLIEHIAAKLPASPAGVPDGLDAPEIAEFAQTVAEFNDCEMTETPQHLLMRWAEMGLLECEQFSITKKGLDLLAAAAQPEES